jgi:hypothetical protein
LAASLIALLPFAQVTVVEQGVQRMVVESVAEGQFDAGVAAHGLVQSEDDFAGAQGLSVREFRLDAVFQTVHGVSDHADHVVVHAVLFDGGRRPGRVAVHGTPPEPAVPVHFKKAVGPDDAHATAHVHVRPADLDVGAHAILEDQMPDSHGFGAHGEVGKRFAGVHGAEHPLAGDSLLKESAWSKVCVPQSSRWRGEYRSMR